MNLSGEALDKNLEEKCNNKRFGFIGGAGPHGQLIRVHNLTDDYECVNIDAGGADADTAGLAKLLGDAAFDGFSISGPYMTKAAELMDVLSDDAAKTHAVNTVRRLEDGRLAGYNTLVSASRYLLEGRVKGGKCLIFGTGGAAVSAAAALRTVGADEIVFVSRDPERALHSEPLSSVDGDVLINAGIKVIGYDSLHIHYDAAVIINCTACGSFPDLDRSPITDRRMSVRMFSGLELAVDLIYDPFRTKFLQDAKRLTGCRTRSGLDMMIVQAAETGNIWMERPVRHGCSPEKIRAVRRSILEEQLNIVAVGMPGSGKTTIFRRYAYELGLDFIDTDAEAAEMMGISVKDALSEGGPGEDYFRMKEHEAVRKACVHRHKVIATGGGTMLNPINRDLLRANGIVVYVRRPLEMLDTRNRPISISRGLTELFRKREGIYRRVSDISLYNTRIFGERKAKTGEGNSYNYELKGFVYYMARKIERYLNELEG